MGARSFSTTSNLPTNGPLPANPTLDDGYYVTLRFDSKGRLYLSQYPNNARIYQIDFNAGHVRLYAGGGTNNDGGVAATTLHATNAFAFDNTDHMYVITICM